MVEQPKRQTVATYQECYLMGYVPGEPNPEKCRQILIFYYYLIEVQMGFYPMAVALQ
jgi:hypothetical protein